MSRPAPRERAADAILCALVLAVLIGLMAPSLAANRHAYFDDTFISLRYAERWLEGHGLTWNDGERVEGYSNLLWIVLTAFTHLLGPSLIDAARLLGLLSLFALLAAFVAPYRPLRLTGIGPPLVAGAVFAAFPTHGFWTLSGMETPLFGALVAWSAVYALALVSGRASMRDARRFALVSILLVLCRPDGAVFVAGFAVAAAVFGESRNRPRQLLALAGPAAAVWLAHTLIRHAYYGDWIPNTARAKYGISLARAIHGLTPWADGMAPLVGLLVPPAVLAGAAWIVRIRRGGSAATAALLPPTESLRRMAVLVVPALAWSAHIISFGGDWSESRHWFALRVLAALFAAEQGRTLAVSKLRRGLRPVLAALLILGVAAAWGLDRRDPYRCTHFMSWRVGPPAEPAIMKRAFGDRKPLAVTGMIGVPSFGTGFPTIDVFGLTDREIARFTPAGFEFALGAGHDRGDMESVARRKPDLVYFGGFSLCDRNPSGGWSNATSLTHWPDFESLYRFVCVSMPEREDGLGFWYRFNAPAIGIVRAPNVLRIPGYALTDIRLGTRAVIDDDGRFVARLQPGESRSVPDIPLPPGQWRAWAEPQSAVSCAWSSDPTPPDADTRSLVCRNEGPESAIVFAVWIRKK